MQPSLIDPTEPAARKRPRTIDVYRALRHAIISGAIPVGMPVVEQEVADELGVSRTPIREALRQLEGLGLVHRNDNGRGYRVRGFTIDDLHQIRDMRLLLEGEAVEEACLQSTEQDLSELDQLIEDMASASRENELGRYREAHREFHLAIVGLAQNRFLKEFVVSMLNYVDMIWEWVRPTGEQITAAQDSHREMVEAIRLGDTVSARRAFETHVNAHVQEVARRLDERARSEPARLRSFLDSQLEQGGG